jgi:hypothetical protein
VSSSRPFVRSIGPVLLSLVLATACGSDSTNDQGAGSGASGSDSAEPIAFTAADLDAYERGLSKEIELVQAAQARAMGGGTPEERAEARRAGEREQTMPEAARAIGTDPERYARVRTTVHEVLTTLDFQGKIEGPMQMDTTRATPEMRARLASDPFAQLPAESAAALRSRLDRLAPLFARYVKLTAVGG